MSDASSRRRKKKMVNVFATVVCEIRFLINNQTEGITLHHARLLYRADSFHFLQMAAQLAATALTRSTLIGYIYKPLRNMLNGSMGKLRRPS